MTPKCDTIEEQLRAHTVEHKQDYKESMLCIQAMDTKVELLTQKFDTFLDENKEYRIERKGVDDAWREEMRPITDAWKAMKWLFGILLAIGGAILLVKNIFWK